MDAIARVVVTLSTVFSVSLAVFVTFSESFISHGEHPDFQLAIGLAIFGVSAASSVAGIVFVWNGTIGFDALAVAVAGLIPALQALMKHFPPLLARVLMMKWSRSLDPTVARFRYLRFDHQAEISKTSPSDRPRMHTRRICYIHFESNHNRKKVKYPMPEIPWGCPMDDFLLDRYKEKLQYRAPKLRDKMNGKNFVWWHAIVTGGSIVARPHLFGFRGQSHAVRTLSVLADIVIIGDAIFELHGVSLKKIYKEDMKNMNKFTKKKDEVTWKDGDDEFTREEDDERLNSDDINHEYVKLQAFRHRVEVSTLVCNSILKSLRLGDWIIDTSTLADRAPVPNERAKRYATLFFMLSLYSNLFQNPLQTSGIDIMQNALLDEPNLQKLDDRLRDATKQWLLQFRLPWPSDDPVKKDAIYS